MRKAGLCLAAVSLLFAPSMPGRLSVAQQPAAPAAPVNRHFDGKWQTTVSCEASRGALAFSYRFDSVVKDGHLRGLRGTVGQPSYLLVEGDLAADGSATLYAKGMTGSKEYVPGRETQPGTEFGYHVNAHFEEKKGSGTRVEGRACGYEFEKK